MSLAPFLVLFSAAATVFAQESVCGAPSSTPSYPSDGASAYINFSQKMPDAPKISFQVATEHGSSGETFQAVVDTGSTGFALDLKTLGISLQQLDRSTQGHLNYGSSGVGYEGYWIDANVTFFDGKLPGATKVQSRTRVLAVTSSHKVTPYMGVGPGRGKDSCYDQNPFATVQTINDRDVSKTIHQGYTMDRSGVHLGLTKSNTKDVKVSKLDAISPLPQNCANPGWDRVKMTLSIDGSATSAGKALIDTGLPYSFIYTPEEHKKLETCASDKTKTNCLPDGTEIKAVIGDQGNPIATYDVTYNKKSTDGHSDSIQAQDYEFYQGTAFLNSGRYMFNGYDAMFDSDCGYFGLRQRESPL